ncbi:MAG: Usg family protein [Alphaproteobacteria bacterium]|nr:Usg family protein [Alphaproteobacteria bacterium]
MASEFEQRLQGARLLTAEVLYWMPDHPKLLQSFLWQTLDVAPRFPRLTRFLDHWRTEIDAVIHKVLVCQSGDLGPPRVLTPDAAYRLH